MTAQTQTQTTLAGTLDELNARYDGYELDTDAARADAIQSAARLVSEQDGVLVLVTEGTSVTVTAPADFDWDAGGGVLKIHLPCGVTRDVLYSQVVTSDGAARTGEVWTIDDCVISSRPGVDSLDQYAYASVLAENVRFTSAAAAVGFDEDVAARHYVTA